MWCEAGHEPDGFWRQTPRTFQLAMKAARNRNEAIAEAATAQAWQTAAFTGATQSKRGLKPLRHYIKRKAQPERQTPAQMLANMRVLAARANSIHKDKSDGE